MEGPSLKILANLLEPFIKTVVKKSEGNAKIDISRMKKQGRMNVAKLRIRL